MSHNQLSVSLSASDAALGDDGYKVVLEQIGLPPSAENVGLDELYRMYLRAQSGFSATQYKPGSCPIGFEENLVHIWFEFFAFPSSKDLQYALTSTIGTIPKGRVMEVAKNHDVVFGLSSTASLDYLPLSASLDWDTPCILENGSTVKEEQPKIVGTMLQISRPLFGVARVNAKAYAIKYQLRITLEKGDSKISNLAPVVTAAWKNPDGNYDTYPLELKVPACIETALTMCGGAVGTKICKKKEDPPVTVYASVCDGSYQGQKEGPDPETWCMEGSPWPPL